MFPKQQGGTMVFEKIDLLSFVSEIEVKKVKKIIRIINDSWLIDQATRGMVITVGIMIFMLAIDVMVLLLGVKEGPHNIDSAQFYLVGVIISGGFVILRQVLCLRRKLWKKKLTERLSTLNDLVLAVAEYNHLAGITPMIINQSRGIEQAYANRMRTPSPNSEGFYLNKIDNLKRSRQLILEALELFQKENYLEVRFKLFNVSY